VIAPLYRPAAARRAGDDVESAKAARAKTRILIASLASGVLYVAVHLAQRAVHRGPDGDTFAAGISLYLIATLGVFTLYVWLLALCRRPLQGRIRILALGLPVLYSLLWLPAAPVFSSDVFAYIAHGYVQVGMEANPYNLHSTAVAASPIGPELSSYGWRPVHPATPYGPLFTHIETGVVRLAGGDVRLAMVLFKLVAVASSVGSAGLIWWILNHVRPQDRDFGTLAYLWNPAVMVEAAGEGHNDALMALLVLLAVALTLQRRVAVAVIAMACAVLAKYLPLLLVPLQVAYFWRHVEIKSRLLWQVAAGALAAFTLSVAMFTPFWIGTQTLTGLGESGRAGHTGSTQTVLVEILSRVSGEAVALRLMSVGVAAAVVLMVVLLTLRVRDAVGMLRMSAIVMVVSMLFAAPAYWPWYVILPVALLALVPHGRLLVLLVSVSLGSRLVAPLTSLYVDAVIDRPVFFLLTWIGAVVIPLLVLLAYHVIDLGEAVPVRGVRRYGAGKP
jgi:alpha-1,6-mannosyltransferase